MAQVFYGFSLLCYQSTVHLGTSWINNSASDPLKKIRMVTGRRRKYRSANHAKTYAGISIAADMKQLI